MTTDAPVLDASAVLAMLWAEPGGPAVRSVMERASADGAQCPMTSVNWGEVLYKIGQRAGQSASQRGG